MSHTKVNSLKKIYILHVWLSNQSTYHRTYYIQNNLIVRKNVSKLDFWCAPCVDKRNPILIEFQGDSARSLLPALWGNWILFVSRRLYYGLNKEPAADKAQAEYGKRFYHNQNQIIKSKLKTHLNIHNYIFIYCVFMHTRHNTFITPMYYVRRRYVHTSKLGNCSRAPH